MTKALKQRLARLEGRADTTAPTNEAIEIDGQRWRRIGRGDVLLLPETLDLADWQERYGANAN